MISVEVEKGVIRSLEKNLEGSGARHTDALKRAINETAKQTQKKLLTEAQKTYVIKAGRFKKAMSVKLATQRKLVAVIGATGRVTELKDFKVSPARYYTGENRPDIIKGKGLRKNNLKKLQKGDIKAFVIKFASGHISVAQRVAKSRLPVKILYSPSIPKMLGNEDKVFGTIKPEIYKDLQDNLDKYVKQAREG